MILLVSLGSLWFAGPAGALVALGTTAAEIADEVDRNGSYLERSADGELDAAIERANGSAVGFVWLDSADIPEVVAEAVSAELERRSSSIRTVVVLSDDGVGAWSETVSTSAIDDGLDAGFASFAAGGTSGAAEGLDAFVTGISTGATTASTTGGSSSSSPSSSADPDGGGIGFGTVLLIAAVAGGGFLLFRRARSQSKAKKQAAIDLEADRAEIKEQLRDNADHVLLLGDRVIASKDAELQRLYEKASATYQEVSQAIDGATTAAEVDELDDRIDQAEWEFESITAKLDGRPVPPSPAEVEAQAETERVEAPPGTRSRSDQPALGPNESVIRGGAPPQSRPRYQPRPRRRGGMGGIGGGLGSILGSIILGGGLGRRTSRRTAQRRSSGGGSFGGTGGGLGGGVLRRGSGSSSMGRGSGRRFGSKRGGGSGRRF